MFWSSPCSFRVPWRLGRNLKRPTVEVLAMELTGVGQGEGNIKKGHLAAPAIPANTQRRGCSPELNKVPLGLSSRGNVWVELHPPHRAWAEATSKECPSSQDSSGRRQARKRQADLPGVGFPLTRAQNGDLPEEIWKTPQKAKRDVIYKLLFFPPKILSWTFFREWVGTLKVLPRKSSLLSFPLLPALLQRGILTVGMDLGSQNPHGWIKQKTDPWCVLATGMGSSGLKRRVWKDAGAGRDKTTRTVRGWDWHDLKSWCWGAHKSLRSRQGLCLKPSA